MLSPVNMFLLGVVDAQPVNPYEIVSRFEYNRYKSILGIANSTIYASIRSMHNKGYLDYALEQESNLPAKKIYSITEQGREELKTAVRESLQGKSSDPGRFMVALLLMHYFSREEVLTYLKEHRAMLQPILEEREDDCKYVEKIHTIAPCIPNVSTSLMGYLQTKVLQETIDVTIDMLEKTDHWPQNTFETDPVYRENYSEWLQKQA